MKAILFTVEWVKKIVFQNNIAEVRNPKFQETINILGTDKDFKSYIENFKQGYSGGLTLSKFDK